MKENVTRRFGTKKEYEDELKNLILAMHDDDSREAEYEALVIEYIDFCTEE